MKQRKKGSMVLVASTAGQRGEALHAHYARARRAHQHDEEPRVGARAVRRPSELRRARLGRDADVGRRDERSERARQGARNDPARPRRHARRNRRAIVFLCTGGASFITGEILNANGGAVLVG